MTTSSFYSRCPICLQSEGFESNMPDGMVHRCKCRSCGEFGISDPLFMTLVSESAGGLTKQNRARVSGWLREQSRPPALSGITAWKGPLLVGSQDKSNDGLPVGEILALPQLSIDEQFEKTLVNIAAMATEPWQEIEVHGYDYPVANVTSHEAMNRVIHELANSEYLKFRVDMSNASPTSRESDEAYQQRFPETKQFIRLTHKGWKAVEDYRKGTAGIDLNQAFIAMKFESEWAKECEAGLDSGIKLAHYMPVRIDRRHFDNRVDDQIIREIRKSRFVVSDVSGQNNGVYFEAGFAIGLGKTVIWTCHQSDFDQRHFDTVTYPYLKWSNAQDLSDLLSARIGALFGEGTATRAES